jgi:hypothetical protein
MPSQPHAESIRQCRFRGSQESVGEIHAVERDSLVSGVAGRDPVLEGSPGSSRTVTLSAMNSSMASVGGLSPTTEANVTAGAGRSSSRKCVGAGYEVALVCVDHHSRFAYAEGLRAENKHDVKPENIAVPMQAVTMASRPQATPTHAAPIADTRSRGILRSVRKRIMDSTPKSPSPASNECCIARTRIAALRQIRTTA